MSDIDTIAGSCACLRVRKAARNVTRLYDAALRPVGMRITQFTIMTALAAHGEVSITDLADGLAMERTTLTRNIRPLEQKGWLAISPEGYRRVRTLKLTASGQRKLESAIPLWKEAQQRMEQKLGRRGLQDFNQMLERAT